LICDWSFDVTNIFDLGILESLMAFPTLASFLYAAAVSICRYPFFKANETELYATSPLGTCHVPNPI